MCQQNSPSTTKCRNIYPHFCMGPWKYNKLKFSKRRSAFSPLNLIIFADYSWSVQDYFTSKVITWQTPTICSLNSYICNCKVTSCYTEATPSNIFSCKLHAGETKKKKKILAHIVILPLAPSPALPTAWHLLLIFLDWVVLLGSLGTVSALSSSVPTQRLLEVLGGKWKELFQGQRSWSSWDGLCSLTLYRAGLDSSRDPLRNQPQGLSLLKGLQVL